jgi:flagellar assembly protein FliH
MTPLSNTIPKEQQSAYERWELSSLGDQRTNNNVLSVRAAADSTVSKLAKEQVESLRGEAERIGYEAGHAAGVAAGLEAGRAEAERELVLLQQLAQSFSGEVSVAHEMLAQEMLQLALDLAKAMLKTALSVRPELVLPIVGEAMRYLPSLQQPALLYLNPQDAALVRSHFGDELSQAGWRVVEDTQTARGGCRIDTASNQIDASIATRWQRIAEALGTQSEWLEP